MNQKKQIKEKIIAGIMAVTILISPFINIGKIGKNKSKSKNSDSKPTTSNVETVMSNQDPVEAKPDFISEINNVESIYNFDFSELTIPNSSITATECNEIYDIDSSDALNRYNKTTDLINQIKKNSNSYLVEHPEFVSAFLIDVKDKYHLDQIATQTILRDVISDILKNSSNKDLCLIKNLKFVISYNETSELEKTFVFYSNEDNLLIVFPNNISNSIENRGNNFWNALKYAIQYELNKIRQQPCNCQKESSVFPYQTLVNAALVSELYNSGKTDFLINSVETQSESLILALGLFHDNMSIDNYYNSIFNNNLQAFYEFCGVSNSEEDIYKLNRILYTIGVINGQNKIMTEITSTDTTKELVGCDYKVDIFGMIINDMIMYTYQHEDFKLKDNLILFNIIKNIIIHNNYIYSENLSNDELNNIITLNNIYIKFLSNHYNVSTTKIEEKENSDEIINNVLVILEICNKNDNISDIDIKYISNGNELIKQFPLLKQILANSTFMPLDYQNYFNNILIDSNTLIKKKS